MRTRRFLAGLKTLAVAAALVLSACAAPAPRGTGDLALVIERAAGRVQILDTTNLALVHVVDGLGDLSHAAAVFSRDGRYAYVFGRDGGLSKVDMLTGRVEARVIQAGNSIGGAISDDGTLVAVANYEPGGIKVFDSATLAQVGEVVANAKVVGIGELPGRRFAFTLYDSGEIWLADMANPAQPKVRRIAGIGRLPYDGTLVGGGRYYIAGLFGEDGLTLVDLWAEAPKPRRILDGYGKGEAPLPVYKMPHLRTWAQAGELLFLPAIGRHEVLVVDSRDWREVGRVPVHGQPVFAIARPDGRQVWVNFAHPHNDMVQVIDVPTLKVVREFSPGRAVLHMEFSPRGEQAWVSARDSDRIVVYDTRTMAELARLPADKPSGIFMAARAHRIGL